MGPNRLGGQSPEGADEIIATAECLKAAGEFDLVEQLGSQVVSHEESILRAHPEWRGRDLSPTMWLILAEEDWEAAHITHEPTLPMDPEQTEVAIRAFRKAANKETPVDEEHRVVIEGMLRQFDDSTATRFDKVKAWLGRIAA